jgi:zinc transporter 5/7
LIANLSYLPKLHHIEGLESYSSPRFWPKDSDTIIGSISLQLKTYSTQCNGIQESTASLSSSFSNGTLADSVSPTMAPEKLVSQVEALLKGKISGLETMIIQCEAAKPTSKENHSHQHHNHSHHTSTTNHNHNHHHHD